MRGEEERGELEGKREEGGERGRGKKGERGRGKTGSERGRGKK